jgi:hypothetical protein
MLSNIAGKFIVGFVKIGIEHNWNIATFGKVSLTLSVSHLVMIFVNAVGIIMYPLLRRTQEDKLPIIYNTMRDILMIILFGILLFYYPFKLVLSIWLPEYADSLVYMGLLFPIVIYEGKISLLINAYLKTLRKEKSILYINVAVVLCSAIFTLIATVLLKNLDLAILSIVILLALKSIISEIYLSKILKIRLIKDTIIEIALTVIFILLAWNIDTFFVTILYGLFYFIYLLMKSKDIKSSINNLKTIIKS